MKVFIGTVPAASSGSASRDTSSPLHYVLHSVIDAVVARGIRRLVAFVLADNAEIPEGVAEIRFKPRLATKP